VSLIIVLAGDRDSLAGWLEQVGTRNEVDIIGGVTQGLAPVADPYVQSQQLAGLVAGLPVGLAYGEMIGQTVSPVDEQLAGVTLAQWLAISALLAGLIYFGLVAPAAAAVSRVTKR
jgi:hypothetical protein